MLATQRIASLQLDERNIPAWNPSSAHERTVAITGLLEKNHFAVRSFPAAGPYNVFLSIPEGRLRMDISSLSGVKLETVILPLKPFQAALTGQSAANDSASALQELVSEQIEIDHATARHLFALVYALHL